MVQWMISYLAGLSLGEEGPDLGVEPTVVLSAGLDPADRAFWRSTG